MSIFEKRFNILLEDEGIAPPSISPEEDTDPGLGLSQALEVDTPDNPGINYKKEETARHTSKIKEWLLQIEQFNTFLNGIEPGPDGKPSMQAQLNSADCDTLFHSVARSETKKISRIAQDLSGVVESLKGYLLANSEE